MLFSRLAFWAEVFLLLTCLCLVTCSSSPPPHPIPVKTTVSLLDLVDRAEVRKEVQTPGEVDKYIHVTQVTIGGQSSRALFLHPKSSITFPLRIEKPLVLETAFALIPEAWQEGSDGVTFYVGVRPQGEHLIKYHVWYYLAPEFWEDYPEWRGVQVDLAPYQGTTIELILGTDPGPHNNPLYDWAVWKEPRIFDPAKEPQ